MQGETAHNRNNIPWHAHIMLKLVVRHSHERGILACTACISCALCAYALVHARVARHVHIPLRFSLVVVRLEEDVGILQHEV